MTPADLDEDSHARLRRKALGNVRSLFERLDYNDKLDRGTERRFAIGAGITVVAVVVVLALLAVTRAQKPGSEEFSRCVQDLRVEAVWKLKKELSENSPELRPTEMNKLLERRFDDAKPGAMSECSRAKAR